MTQNRRTIGFSLLTTVITSSCLLVTPTAFAAEHATNPHYSNYYDSHIYDQEGYNLNGYDRDGYDREGYSHKGYDREGYDREGYSHKGYDREGYDREGYSHKGYDREGYDRDGYDDEGYDREGYDGDGFDREGYNREGYNRQGYNREGYNHHGYDDDGYNDYGFDDEGYNRKGYDDEGYDREGYNHEGYDRDGYDRDGYNHDGYDREGYDREGYNHKGYNREGYDREGYQNTGVKHPEQDLLYTPIYLTHKPLRRQFNRDPLRDPKYNKLPNPRAISNALLAQTGNTSNVKKLSDMFWLWGQFLDHDINLSEMDREKFLPITMPANDPVFSMPMEFFRSQTNTANEQLNDITPYIDGSNIYGSSKQTELSLRTGKDGKFIIENGYLPTNDRGMYQSGDIRTNENIALTSMHTIWVREHNRIADKLAKMPYAWTDEKLFNAARKIVVAEMQSITYNEFLPLLLGKEAITAYKGYDSKVSPQIFNSFSTAAFRFGHTMLSSTLLRLDKHDQVIQAGNVSLAEAFFNPQLFEDTGIDSLFLGMSAQIAQAVDPLLIDDVRNLLFANVEGETQGFDLATLNIQRGRDHQLPSYNAVRKAMGLVPVKTFSSPVFRDGFADKIKAAYKHPDEIDLWVGGLLEKREGNSLFGPVFTSIIKLQFENIRNGDPSWYESAGFSYHELEKLKNTRLADVIKRNTGITTIQNHAFIARFDKASTTQLRSTRRATETRVLDENTEAARARARGR